MFPSFRLIAWRVAWRGALDRKRDKRGASMRWTFGPPDPNQGTCYKSYLSEVISTVNQRSYSGRDQSQSVDSSTYHDRWMKIKRMIKSDAPLHLKTWTHLSPPSVIERMWLYRTVSINRRFIATIDRKAHVHPTVTPNFLFKYTVLRNEKTALEF